MNENPNEHQLQKSSSNANINVLSEIGNNNTANPTDNSNNNIIKSYEARSNQITRTHLDRIINL
jgi:hypothetical protein